MRPYVRPLLAALAGTAGHNGCALACRAPDCSACSRHGTSTGIARSVSTTDFPTTPNGTSRRISRARARCSYPPSPPIASRHGGRLGDRGRSDAAARAVALLARHQRPGDARRLVRQRDRRQPGRPPRQHAAYPGPGRAVPPPGPHDHRRRPHDQRCADRAVARLGDAAQPRLAASRTLPRHQARVCGR